MLLEDPGIPPLAVNIHRQGAMLDGPGSGIGWASHSAAVLMFF